jgi:alpha-mannosidase
MKNLWVYILLLFLAPAVLNAQPVKERQKYDLLKDRVLYTVGYAHLDTEWNWDYPTTINLFIKSTMEDNFRLFEKYPDYVFNFTGSRRYEMMKEYYPELYKKVGDYIKQGRWYVSGSSVDEGEVNISSSESLIRQVLYGNDFFRKEFGTESYDYMLPDCFGFVASLPSILNHCGILGFSTQKLSWGSAVGIPFNVGVWNGPDGKGIIAALNATDYTGRIAPSLDKDTSWNERINDDQKKYGISFDYRYYGVGDQGGSPRDRDVYNVCRSLNNNSGGLKVILTSSDQMYRDITPEIRSKLPVYSGDLLLTEHSAGSLTSQSFMKRMNRKNELLAKEAELLATQADWTGNAAYPLSRLNRCWDLVLGSQFHDILPGTSIPKAYEYAWNDEFIAANGFADVLTSSLSTLSRNLDTRVKGRAVIVYNPVASVREDIVTARLVYTNMPKNIRVLDKDGKVVPSQVTERNGDTLKFIFLAKVNPSGLTVFDVQETNEDQAVNARLKVSASSLENDYYTVKFDSKGNIAGIYDKKDSKELMSQPASLVFLHEEPSTYPAWNMDWKDRKNPPIASLDQNVTMRIVENGPVRIAVEITRTGLNSEIKQVISLAAGEAGKHIEVVNKLDWQSREVSLKAAFPFNLSNQNATYNLGAGTIERSTNNEVKYEVPSNQWIDITDASGKYGVSLLEDCKYGSDKPDDHTLRLTLMYTPKTSGFNYQSSQDWGIHDFRYGIYAHSGNWVQGGTQQQGSFFNQPLLAFEAPEHAGTLGKEWSFLKLNSDAVGVMALKKMEDGDYYIIRVNELHGMDEKNIQVSFAGKIADAYEVNGQEKRTGKVNFSGNKITFDISHYGIRTFAVRPAPAEKSPSAPIQQTVTLAYNDDIMSYDDNKGDGEMSRGCSLPAEMVGDSIINDGIVFKTGNKAEREMNAVICDGKTITLPKGSFNRLYILAAATDNTSGDFVVDGKVTTLPVQRWTGYIGQFYNRQFTADSKEVTSIDDAWVNKDNIAWFASHRHRSYPLGNDAYQYSYLYTYVIDIPENAAALLLPANKKIKIVAITVAKSNNDDIKPLQPLYDDFAGNPVLKLRNSK